MEVLRRAVPVAVEGHCSHGAGHERDPDARPEPVRSRHDRVLSFERDGAPDLCPGQVDSGEEVIESCQRVEALVHREPPASWWKTESVGTEKCESKAVTARGPRSGWPAVPAAPSVSTWMSLPSVTATIIRASWSTGTVGTRSACSSASVTRTASSDRTRQFMFDEECGHLRPTNGMQGELHGDECPLPVDLEVRPGAWFIGTWFTETSGLEYVAGRHGPANPLGPSFPAAIEQGEEQGVLVGEVRVEGSLGQPGPGADVGDGCRPETLFGEEFHRGVQQCSDGDRSTFCDSSRHTTHLISS